MKMLSLYTAVTLTFAACDSYHKIENKTLADGSPDTAKQQQICSNSAVPNGYVITGYSNCISCPGNGNNCITIQTPFPYPNSTTICASSPIPAGYVIIAHAFAIACPNNSGNNAFTIKIPSDQETICNGSPIPPGYHMIGQTHSNVCANWNLPGNNAIIIHKK
ncbi:MULTISPECIES: hypothetical protein [Niastella]|uniref:Secreted protein n=1 Tax=Niastella soli TaxID=2821487 RepID=A0ABS3Z3L7_9BACT|nr:hypothetical protein [Niastella soli]MBO9204628.1 hypothetical protein [Niastella soli]